MKTLTEMGVTRFNEISRYTITHKNAKSDELRIYYKREKGSFRPVCRTYEFGRALQTKVGDSGTARFDDTYEISPILLDAISELDKLLDAKSKSSDLQNTLLKKLDELQDIAERNNLADSLADDIQKLRNNINALA